MYKKFLLVLLLGLVGCTSASKKRESLLLKKIRSLKVKNRIQEKRISSLKEKNLVIETLLSEKNSLIDNRPNYQKIESLEEKVINRSKDDWKSEYYLYGKVIESYRTKNDADIERLSSMFIKTYPKSVHADNSIYLSGLLLLEKKKYQKAIDYFNQLESNYPQSNKLVSGIFSKGKAYEQIENKEEAVRQFNRVAKIFPYSIEAQQVKKKLSSVTTSTTSKQGGIK